MLPIIESVKPLSDYQLFVHFQDGTEGVVDLSHLAGKGVFRFWDHYGNFMKAHVNPESGAVSWNEDLDIDTLSLYAQLGTK